MLLAAFEPAIPSTKRPQTYALDREATGIGVADNGMEISNVCSTYEVPLIDWPVFQSRFLYFLLYQPHLCMMNSSFSAWRDSGNYPPSNTLTESQNQVQMNDISTCHVSMLAFWIKMPCAFVGS
jgi:hypothetical protein